jgi:hypothetical protein
MLLINFSFQGYAVVVVIAIFLSLMDAILTFINSKIYGEYYKLEILPWYRLIYKSSHGWSSLFLSIMVNILIFVAIFFLPISITWFVALLGFWIYRVYHSSYRLYLLTRK